MHKYSTPGAEHKFRSLSFLMIDQFTNWNWTFLSGRSRVVLTGTELPADILPPQEQFLLPTEAEHGPALSSFASEFISPDL
jgi:hypothetical protein